MVLSRDTLNIIISSLIGSHYSSKAKRAALDTLSLRKLSSLSHLLELLRFHESLNWMELACYERLSDWAFMGFSGCLPVGPNEMIPEE
jgi:hypothetical protein